jgi:hypothetical protein
MAADEGATEAIVADQPEETPEAVAAEGVDTDALQNQLREKEQLVAALTERLEQAAEQLDRIRRTGVDKGRRAQGTGRSSDLVEDHKHTLEDLKRVITNWEDIQAGATLGRIETQIIELRDLITASLHGGSFTASLPRLSSAAASSPPPAAAPAREGKGETAASHSGGKPGTNAWWEAQKAALMGEPVPAEVQAAPTAAQTPPAPEPAANEEQPAPSASCNLAEVVIPDLPAPVDLDSITLEDARAAIRERDRIIQQMREPLLLLKASGQLPLNLHSLENLPEPMRARITELENQWQAKFRQVELDLSLERARLAREQAAVRQQQDALQKQLRNGTLAGRAGEGDGEAGLGEESASSKRRWFRFMGKAQETAGDAEPKGEDQ